MESAQADNADSITRISCFYISQTFILLLLLYPPRWLRGYDAASIQAKKENSRFL